MNYEAWERHLPEDNNDRKYIPSGIKNGFRTVDSDKIKISFDVDNFKSATNGEMRARTETQIKNESDNGHYKVVRNKPTIGLALGVILKQNQRKSE